LNAERETRLVKGGLEVKNAEQLHAVVRDGIFVTNYVDVPIGKPVEHVVNQFRVRDWLECLRRFRRQNGGELIARKLRRSRMSGQLLHVISP
jgi:hypothetical protein